MTDVLRRANGKSFGRKAGRGRGVFASLVADAGKAALVLGLAIAVIVAAFAAVVSYYPREQGPQTVARDAKAPTAKIGSVAVQAPTPQPKAPAPPIPASPAAAQALSLSTARVKVERPSTPPGAPATTTEQPQRVTSLFDSYQAAQDAAAGKAAVEAPKATVEAPKAVATQAAAPSVAAPVAAPSPPPAKAEAAPARRTRTASAAPGSAGCERYKSYNAATHTYRSFDGRTRECRPR